MGQPGSLLDLPECPDAESVSELVVLLELVAVRLEGPYEHFASFNSTFRILVVAGSPS